jgi:hypothetical protein
MKKTDTALSSEELNRAIEAESKEFANAYKWLEEHLPPSFLEEVDFQTRILVARNLMSFRLQGCFSQIYLQNMGIVLSWDAPDADVKILSNLSHVAIHYYRTFVSNQPPPGEASGLLRVAILYFRDVPKENHKRLEPQVKDEIIQLIKERNQEFDPLNCRSF